MALPIKDLITQRNAVAYRTPRGADRVKTLSSGSAFHITDYSYKAFSDFWVKSGAGDWYKFDDQFLRKAVYISGGGPVFLKTLMRNGLRGVWLCHTVQNSPPGSYYELHRVG